MTVTEVSNTFLRFNGMNDATDNDLLWYLKVALDPDCQNHYDGTFLQSLRDELDFRGVNHD